MKIAVCVKQSIDTEALITLGSDGEVSTEGANIIDPMRNSLWRKRSSSRSKTVAK